MTLDVWMITLVVLAIAASVVASGVALWPKLRDEEQGYPYEAEIEAILEVWIYRGICGAYKLSDEAAEKMGQLIGSADRKKIASMIYTMLPDEIAGVPIRIIKTWISPERFEVMVQNIFDEFDRFYRHNLDRYDELFNEWAEDNKPRTGPDLTWTVTT